jgi:hypothetical protein
MLKNKEYPPQDGGSIYYIRLKTEFGPIYKLGFTSLSSVHERLSYQGLGHERFIDKVFLFIKVDNAYEKEQILHRYFSRNKKQAFPVADPEMPFFGNGQSELYFEDVLRMDVAYSDEQSANVRFKILRHKMRHAGESEEEIKKLIDDQKDVEEASRFLDACFSRLAKVYVKIRNLSLRLLFRKSIDTIQDHKQSEEEEIIAYLKILRARVRKEQLDALSKESAALDNLAKTKSSVIDAIAAFRDSNLAQFEASVNIDAFAYNLAEAMISDYMTPSDYSRIPMMCCMFDLCHAMTTHPNPRDLLLKPVEDTHKAVLRHYIKTHSLLTEEIIFPDDPVYLVDGCASGDDLITEFSDSFGPRSYLDVFGREFSIADIPDFREDTGGEWVEFELDVINTTTDFRGALKIRATLRDGRVDLSFPNWLEVDEAAWKQKELYEDCLDPTAALARVRLPHRNALRHPDEIKCFTRAL